MTFNDRFLLYFYEQHTVDRFQTDDNGSPPDRSN